MKKKKIVITVTILVVVVLGIILGVFLVRRQQNIRTKAAPATTLEVIAPLYSIEAGDTFDISISISTGENLVAGTELQLKFDNNFLEAQSVSMGSFLTTPNEIGPVIDNDNGEIYYALLTPPGVDPKQGSGNIATVAFKALQAGTTQISFDQQGTIAVAVKEGGANVLIGAQSATVKIDEQLDVSGSTGIGGGGDLSGTDDTSYDDLFATPTPDPSATTTPTPTGTPTPDPSATATPTGLSSLESSSSPEPSTLPDDIPVTGVDTTLVVIFASALFLLGSVLFVLV